MASNNVVRLKIWMKTVFLNFRVSRKFIAQFSSWRSSLLRKIQLPSRQSAEDTLQIIKKLNTNNASESIKIRNRYFL